MNNRTSKFKINDVIQIAGKLSGASKSFQTINGTEGLKTKSASQVKVCAIVKSIDYWSDSENLIRFQIIKCKDEPSIIGQFASCEEPYCQLGCDLLDNNT